ncbi:hypothetical protein JCM30471_00990 [Desulfuromonas carbonis]|uniref:PH domain-containing protein n=1 Tax=Desulfuromonas sp. DDH964 TaxID=1823759 RepID=UPI00078D187D|nr:PH domain-containing protein [Desulfuromonas sp. DDH964]AMV71840.1 hypothetical protein DBW_1479 [Desulfuromonas sp. DDH964]
MNWEQLLSPDEVLVWEGRPAPRCYTFRNWRHALFGVLLLFLSLYWLTIAVQLAAVYHWPWLPLLPIPFLLTGLALSLGQLLLARLEWEQVFYAVTDRRILVRRGLRGRRLEELPLAELGWLQLRPQGKELGTLRIRDRADEKRLTLCCVEYPRTVADLLEAALVRTAGECLLRSGG